MAAESSRSLPVGIAAMPADSGSIADKDTLGVLIAAYSHPAINIHTANTHTNSGARAHAPADKCQSTEQYGPDTPDTPPDGVPYERYALSALTSLRTYAIPHL